MHNTVFMYKFDFSLKKIIEPLQKKHAANCALLRGRIYKGTNTERVSVAKLLNNASGQLLLPFYHLGENCLVPCFVLYVQEVVTHKKKIS